MNVTFLESDNVKRLFFCDDTANANTLATPAWKIGFAIQFQRPGAVSQGSPSKLEKDRELPDDSVLIRTFSLIATSIPRKACGTHQQQQASQAPIAA